MMMMMLPRTATMSSAGSPTKMIALCSRLSSGSLRMSCCPCYPLENASMAQSVALRKVSGSSTMG